MSEFIRNPEGNVVIRSTAGVYFDTQANFELDYGAELEPLPAGADQMIYRQGVSHAYIDGADGNLIAGGPVPWALGDDIIASVPRLLQAQHDRQPPPPPPLQPHLFLSHRQFYEVAAVKGAITQGEALDAVRHGTIPEKIAIVVNQLPADQRFHAEMLLSGASTFDRNHPMTDAIGHALGYSDEEMDEIWKLGMTL
jgi:hypothetical protein